MEYTEVDTEKGTAEEAMAEEIYMERNNVDENDAA